MLLWARPEGTAGCSTCQRCKPTLPAHADTFKLRDLLAPA
jgi:hypothetical protein